MKVQLSGHLLEPVTPVEMSPARGPYGGFVVRRLSAEDDRFEEESNEVWILGADGSVGGVGAKRETILNNDWKYIPSLFPFLPQHPQQTHQPQESRHHLIPPSKRTNLVNLLALC